MPKFKDYKYHYLYRITNQLNGMHYVGIHSTNKMDDGYMGSGTYLKFAIEKYGVENFTKEVLYHFKTRAELYQAEKEMVNPDFVMNKNTYNLVLGGEGILRSDLSRAKTVNDLDYQENLLRQHLDNFTAQSAYNIEIIATPENAADPKKRPISRMFTDFAIKNPKLMVAIALSAPEKHRERLLSRLRSNGFVFRYSSGQLALQLT